MSVIFPTRHQGQDIKWECRGATLPPREQPTKSMRARGFKGPWASPTPGHDSTSWCWWGPRKGSFKRDFSRIGSVGAQGDKQWAWGLGWEGRGDSPACVARAPPSSQFLSGTVMPICHFGGLGQCLQLHSPGSRWPSHPPLPLLPPLASPPGPLRSRAWAKANSASQHLLLPEKRVLGCHGDQNCPSSLSLPAGREANSWGGRLDDGQISR